MEKSIGNKHERVQQRPSDVWGLNRSVDERGLFISWQMTYWCNYKCSYCFQKNHERRKLNPVARLVKGSWESKKKILRGQVPYNHAFDNFSVEEWCNAFDKFKNHNTSWLIDGGEIFLDYKKVISFFEKFVAREYVKSIAIISNVSVVVRPEHKKLFASPKIWFFMSFHPEHISLEKFYQRVASLKEAGWNIASIDFVFTPEKMELFEKTVAQFAKIDIKVNPNPDLRYAKLGCDDKKRAETVKLLKDYLNELDLGYKAGTEVSKGKLCRYPMISINVLPDGEAAGLCFWHKRRTNIFAKSFKISNVITAGPVPCPKEQCYTLHQYPFLCGSDDRYLDTFNIFKRHSEVALLRQKRTDRVVSYGA